MIATYSPSDAQVIVAVVTGAVALILEVLRRQSNAQRGDHAATASMVTEIRDDMREVKADLRDVKDEVRSHGDRLRSLEHMTVTQDHTDRVVADNARKLESIRDHQNKESA